VQVSQISQEQRQYKNDIVFTKNVQTIIDTFINNMDKPKYEEIKKTEIKLIIYNNRDKITREIVKNLEIII